MPDVQVAKETAAVATKDFFISYNHDDKTWAEWIAWQLEQAGFTTIVQAWDFRPGGNFVLEMQNATAASRRTIAVFSPSYLKSSFTVPEWTAAFALDPTGRDNKLVPVRVRPCHPEGLLGQIIYIDLVDLDDVSARNTLLNGIGVGRNKPVSAPAFPGSSAPTFPGPATAPPPETGDAPSSVHIRIDFPTEISGIETCEIVLGFTIAGAGAELFLEFQQDGFYIDSESDPEAALDADRFRFYFPSPGTFQRKLLIRAKKAENANYRVSASCHDASGKVWTRNTWYVRVTEAPRWWKLLRFPCALWTIVRRRPVLYVALALLAVVVWIGVTFGASEDGRRKLVLWAWLWSPKNYFPSKREWNDFFEDGPKTNESWYRRGAEWRERYQRHPTLAISDGGFAVTKKDLRSESFYGFDSSFYDFDSSFQLILPKAGTASWAFGVRPQSPPADIERSAGYRFKLAVVSQATGAVIKLQGFTCDQLGEFDKCKLLFSPTAEDVGITDCAENSTFVITGRRVGTTFTFWVSMFHEDRSSECAPQLFGRKEFHDNRFPLRYLSFFGGVGFLDALDVQRVQIVPPGTLATPDKQ